MTTRLHVEEHRQMTIAVTCCSCRTTFRVKDEHAGKRGKCPRCQTAINVPATTEPEPQPAILKSLSIRDILNAFHGVIDPVPRTGAYRVGIVIVTLAMLLLPVIYLGLMAGVVYLLFLHATVNVHATSQMRSWYATVFLYVGPLVVGAILLFFMVKPLFARRSRFDPVRTLHLAEEPLLFALVTRVAQTVGAPEPKRIAVNCQPNASASFDTFLGGEMVLTIGLPLAARLTVQQLAGVIAHELGHFSQRTGMRLSFVVRSINAWFARVVCERDDWDQRLVNGSEREDWVALFYQLALLCVWLTRRVLWVLMAIGHSMSCFMLRQMEYDADRYETRLAGTEAFAETNRALLVLGLATDMTNQVTMLSWIRNSRLPDDLGALIDALADTIPQDTILRMETALAKSRAGFFDTHPAHGERLANARRENAPGVIHLPGPAMLLFKDFAKMSRAVTMDFFRKMLGKRVVRDAFVGVAAFLGDEEKSRKAPPVNR
jgi:Zn-dependent protease with chaperone function